MQTSIVYSLRPIYTSLDDLKCFKGACVICLKSPTPLAVNDRGRKKYRIYDIGSFLILAGNVWSVYGNFVPGTPFSTEHVYSVLDKLGVFHAVARIASLHKGRQHFVRQTGIHRGKVYHHRKLNNQTLFTGAKPC